MLDLIRRADSHAASNEWQAINIVYLKLVADAFPPESDFLLLEFPIHLKTRPLPFEQRTVFVFRSVNL